MTDNKQLDIVNKLRQIANAEVGGAMPECLRAPDDKTGFDSWHWGPPLSAICKEAADEIVRLQEYEWMYKDLCK